MIKIENAEVMGWEHAIRGMRNPMNSWEKSDSRFNMNCDFIDCEECPCHGEKNCVDKLNMQTCKIGPNDHDLMMKLKNAGSDHRKFIRYLEVYLDITAPLYWWKEFKTYRHGRKFMDDEDFFDYDDEILEMHVETNSCSTMHKIHEKEFTMDDFSCEHLIRIPVMDASPLRDGSNVYSPYGALECVIIKMLNECRDMYLKTYEKTYWWQMIQLLPSSYNQKRTVKLSYEVLARMYKSRKNHKLDEWRDFCEWIESLPYSEIITGEVGGKEE